MSDREDDMQTLINHAQEVAACGGAIYADGIPLGSRDELEGLLDEVEVEEVDHQPRIDWHHNRIIGELQVRYLAEDGPQWFRCDGGNTPDLPPWATADDITDVDVGEREQHQDRDLLPERFSDRAFVPIDVELLGALTWQTGVWIALRDDLEVEADEDEFAPDNLPISLADKALRRWWEDVRAAF